MLSLLHHTNLVNLVGYCADGDQRILVYEYMPNGSLDDHLLGIYTSQTLQNIITYAFYSFKILAFYFRLGADQEETVGLGHKDESCGRSS